MDTRGHQPRDMRHVHHKKGADLFGDRAEFLEINPPRIRRVPREQELGLLAEREPTH